MTKIMKCSCQSEFQDKHYGKDRRVHNDCKGNSYRCTVCSNVKFVGSTEVKGKK